MVRGAAVVDGNVAYFISLFGHMFSYNLLTKKWSEFLIVHTSVVV